MKVEFLQRIESWRLKLVKFQSLKSFGELESQTGILSIPSIQNMEYSLGELSEWNLELQCGFEV